MALNGSFQTNIINTSDVYGRYYVFSWSAAQDVAGNYSIIHWTLTAADAPGKDYNSWVAERTVKVTINNTVVLYKDNRVERKAGLVSQGDFVIHHDANGNANISVTVQIAAYYTNITISGSGSWTLNKINRGISHVYDNGWQKCQCYVYDNGWQMCAPYVYDNGWQLY